MAVYSECVEGPNQTNDNRIHYSVYNPRWIAYILFALIFRLPRHICHGFKLFRHTNPQYGEGYMYLNSKKTLQGQRLYFLLLQYYYGMILSYFSESQ